MNGYTQKLVISGDFLELYQFQKKIKKGFEVTKEQLSPLIEYAISDMGCKLIKEKRLLTTNWQKSQFSLTRTRRNIRRLINANKTMSKFLTLTFADNVCDIDFANYEFKKFIERLKYQYPTLDLKYLTVIEFQKRGAVHYHMILNTPKIKASKIAELWGNGFIKINQIKKCDNVGAYVSKYLSKESTERLFNRKKFFCSRNLEKPVEIVDNFVIDNLLEMYKIKDIKPRYETIITNDFVGDVKYYQFKLNYDNSA